MLPPIRCFTCGTPNECGQMFLIDQNRMARAALQASDVEVTQASIRALQLDTSALRARYRIRNDCCMAAIITSQRILDHA